MVDPSPIKLLSVQAVAEYLGVSRTCVYQLCSSNQIAHFRLGVGRGAIRFRKSDVDQYLNESKQVRADGEQSDTTAKPSKGFVSSKLLKHLRLS